MILWLKCRVLFHHSFNMRFLIIRLSIVFAIICFTQGELYIGLIKAIESGKLDDVIELVSLGANINNENGYPIFVASMMGHRDILDFLSKKMICQGQAMTDEVPCGKIRFRMRIN